jgi:hypothetical protein
MSFWADDRGAAVQVGAIVLFAFVIIAITAYQTSVVPNQNEQVEFDHNQQIQGQLTELQGVVGSTPTAGGGRTVVVETSTTYPARTIFVNPPPPTGTLETVGTGDPAVAIEVRNAEAAGETKDFWDGRTHNYTTGALVYRPNYHAYAEAPVSVVGNSLVYNRFDDETIVTNAQSIFDGRKITLVALNGSYREQGGAASVTVRPVSASSNRIEVTGNSSDPVTIAIVTRLGSNPTEAADRWETMLTEAGEMSGSGGYVDAVNPGPAVGDGDAFVVEFVMDSSETYSLALAKAGVGSNVNAAARDRYATRASPRNVSTTADAAETVAVEVRDEFNNPVSGVPMNATIESASGPKGSIAEPNGTETDADGVVRFTYQAPDAKTTTRVNVSIAKAGGEAAAATFKVSVSKASGSGGGGNGAYNVTLVNPETTNAPAGAVDCPNWPTNRTCIVDGSQVSTANVTMGTQPTASGAGVTWAVNDTNVATVDPSSGTTEANGENSTDVALKQNGEVVVYATSGASGNRTTLRVTNFGGGLGPDTTPPTLDSGTVSTTADKNSKLTSITWDYTASDGRGNFSNVTLVAVKSNNGQELWNVTNSQSSAVLQNSDGWNYKKQIDLTVTLRDSAGNVRTCTATIANPGGTAQKADFSCTPTQRVIPTSTTALDVTSHRVTSVQLHAARESPFDLAVVRERRQVAVARGD